MPEIPFLHGMSTREKVAELQRREFDLGRQVREPYEVVLRGWRENIERDFLSHFVIDFNKQQAWNPTVAAAVETQLIEPLEAAITEVEDALLDDLEDEEEDAYEFGMLFGLWELSLGGVEVGGYAMPEESDYRGLVAAMAFAGLPLADRLRAWGDTYVDKYRRVLRGNIVQGATLPETLSTIDLLQPRLPAYVATLAVNETFRAFTHGSRKVYEDFETAWIWVTAEDERVCPQCAPLHLTITTLVPVDDTHTDCRCVLLPYIRGFTPTPSSFAAFAQGFAV